MQARQPQQALSRQHLNGLMAMGAAALLLAGCGKAPVAVAAPSQVLAAGGASHSAAPKATGTGSITMSFKLPAYRLQATSADIATIEVLLRQRVFLLWRNLGTARVTREQMLAGKAAVQFTGLAAGTYELKIDALSDKMVKLAATSAKATVEEGKVTQVAAGLKLGVL